MPSTPALETQRQMDLPTFKASLGYIVRPSLKREKQRERGNKESVICQKARAPASECWHNRDHRGSLSDLPLIPFQVSDSPPGEDDIEGSGAGDLSGAGSGDGSGWAGEEAEGDEDENMVYYFLEESTGYMEPALRCLSLLHTLVAFLCIIGYNCLKVRCHL